MVHDNVKLPVFDNGVTALADLDRGHNLFIELIEIHGIDDMV